FTNDTACVHWLTPPRTMPQAAAVMHACAPDCWVTELPQPAAATSANSKLSFFMSDLLLGVFGAPLVEQLEDRVDAANRVAHLVFSDVVVGLELEALVIKEGGGLVVFGVLRRRLALEGRLAEAFELAGEPRPEVAEHLFEQLEVAVELAVDLAVEA